MRKMVKRATAGAVLGGSLLFTGGLAIAGAAPGSDVNDQLVDLGIGSGSTLHELNVNVAAQIAGLLCGTGVTGTAENSSALNGPSATGMSVNETTQNAREITALANQVDAGQIPTTTCDSSQGVVTISQNVAANSPNAITAPGQQRENPAPPTAPVPTTAPAPTPNS